MRAQEPVMRRPSALALALCAGAMAAMAPAAAFASDQLPLLQSVLWIQQSIEYRASTQTIYRAATVQLKAAVARPGSASLETGPGQPRRRPAVVLDLDETAIDNSAYSAWMVQQGVPYDEPSWQRWMALEQAAAVPGAVEFTRQAARRGIAVFYVTNRECVPAGEADPCPAKRHTMANLARLGFPRADDPAALLMKGERPDWGSDKSSRRQWIAGTHRIVMLFGDDLRDFLPVPAVEQLRAGEAEPELQQRLSLFGQRWFMLPNPMYGSWEQRLPASVEGRLGALKAVQP